MDGSPYFIEEWNLGEIKGPKGVTYESVRIRYNIYEGNLEIIKDGIAIAVDKKQVESFTITEVNDDLEEISYHFSRIIGGNETNKFYQVLFEGETSLLVDYTINKVNIVSQGYNTTAKTDRFALSSEYYLYDAESGYVKFRPKNKEFLSVIASDRKDAINKYLSQNKLNVKREEDLVNIVEYYNTL